jgi:indole-3-glycerol phosphate synthase
MTRPTLDMVVARRREDVAARRAARPLAALEAMVPGLPPTRGFARALAAAPRKPAVIAEIKQASPSGGLLRPDFDPGAIAEAYAAAGATCLSILTEEAYFRGDLGNLGRARTLVDLPLLQKDFLFDPYQVVEARVYGADAVLLIAAILSDAQLRDLAALAGSLGLDVLLEVHDEAELERAVEVPTPMLGVNNRSLKTYDIDLATTGELVARLGDRRAGRVLVGESGIRTADDVRTMVDAGADAVLIGETLMRRPDLGAAFAELFGAPAGPTA